MSDLCGSTGADAATGTGCGGGGCGGACGTAYVPELDARQLDPIIRQSAVFGVLMGLAPGRAVRVVVNTDPAGIAELLADRLPGEYAVDVDTISDDEYRALFTRAESTT